jgi:hypothetical protein
VVALVVMAGLTAAVSGRSDDFVVGSADAPLPQGAFAQCKDGTFSDNTEVWNTCIGAHGVMRWLGPDILCRDGRILALTEKTSCGVAGVDRLVAEKDAPILTTSTTLATSIGTSTTATTVRPTAAAAVAAVAPTVPSLCTATVSNARPTRGTTVTVAVVSNQPNTPAQLSINYRTTTMNQTATTDSAGSANVAISIGAATIGYTVDVAIDIGTARCSTTFTPAA